MTRYKSVLVLGLFAVILISFTQCKCAEPANKAAEIEQTESANNTVESDTMEQTEPTEETKNTQTTPGRGKEIPLFVRGTYFQRNLSGTTIYFPTLINKANYKLETVYFRGMTGEMQTGKTAHFAQLKSSKDQLDMSNNPNKEYGNTKPEPFPFEINPDECMIKYIDKGKTKYFQVYNIIEKK